MTITVHSANAALIVINRLLNQVKEPIKVRGGQWTREIVGACIHILDPTRRIIIAPGRKFRSELAAAEFLWYMTGIRDVSWIERYIPRWREFADKDGMVSSNYGWHWNYQMKQIIKILRGDPSSRRAVITIYNGNVDLHDQHSKDVPCTMSIQFLIRDNKLVMIVSMRSNDLWWGFCNDQFCFSLIQEILANELSVGIGSYVHMTGSMHIYNRHWDRILDSAEGELTEVPRSIVPYTFTGFFDELRHSIKHHKDDNDIITDAVRVLGIPLTDLLQNGGRQ